MYMYYTLNEFTQFSRMIQKLKTDVWLWSFFQYYEQTALLRTTRKEEGLSKPTAWIDTELKDSYSPTSDYKFNTSTMFFHNPAFTFHHITRENIRPLHAGQIKPSIKDVHLYTKHKAAFRAKDSRISKKDSRPPLLFALALVWHSSAQVLHFKVTKYSETQ